MSPTPSITNDSILNRGELNSAIDVCVYSCVMKTKKIVRKKQMRKAGENMQKNRKYKNIENFIVPCSA